MNSFNQFNSRNTLEYVPHIPQYDDLKEFEWPTVDNNFIISSCYELDKSPNTSFSENISLSPLFAPRPLPRTRQITIQRFNQSTSQNTTINTSEYLQKLRSFNKTIYSSQKKQ